MSWDEDAAYRRLLDVYYTLEKPIPPAQVYRLVVAASKTQRQAVDSVLNDFFKQTPMGWLHERCEAELDAMRVKQAAQEDKDRHETDRMRRYRERRSSMFDALRLVEIVPAWDVPMKELQRLFDTYCNAPVTPPVTRLQREQAVAGVTPATAIPTPTPTPTPTPVIEEKSPRKRGPPSRPDEISETVWQDFLAIRKAKRAPLTDTAMDGIKREAEKAGIPLVDAIKACCEFGWQGFNAGWYAERQAKKPMGKGGVPVNKQEALEASNAAVAERFLRNNGYAAQ